MRDVRWSLKSLTPEDNGLHKDGSLPVTITLPVGDYERVINRTKCSPYIDTVHVQPMRTDTLTRRNPVC
jgi:hypothetical protein